MNIVEKLNQQISNAILSLHALLNKEMLRAEEIFNQKLSTVSKKSQYSRSKGER